MTELPTWNGQPGLGPLAAALAKAQSEFAAVTKDKTVVVQKKTGGSYSFKYAPLDQILSVVKGPLSKNGLALVQLLDTDALVTMLIHDSGATLEARTPLPSTADVQAYGSAITYHRRYAVQAMLGIAAEDDDDGNRAAGNQTEVAPDPDEEVVTLIGVDTLTGKIAKGGSGRYQCEWRELPDGGHVIGFAIKRAKAEADFPQVGLMGNVANGLYATGDFAEGPELVGHKVTLRGRFYSVRYPNRTDRQGFTRVIVGQGDGDYIQTDDWRIPPATEANPEGVSPLRDPEQDVIPVAEGQLGFDQAESDRIDAEAAKAV
jgi:hypothetical protein